MSSRFRIGECYDIDYDNVTTNLSRSEYPEWRATETYAFGDFVVFDGHIYKSIVAGNNNLDPSIHSSDDFTPFVWSFQGSPNDTAAIDAYTSTKSVNETGSIEYRFTGLGGVAAVALMKASGQEAIVECLSGGNVVSTHTKNILGFSTSSYISWRFDDPEPALQSQLFSEIPYVTDEIKVTITGAPTSIGDIILLKSLLDFGSTLIGSNFTADGQSKYSIQANQTALLIPKEPLRNMSFKVHAKRDEFESYHNQVEELMKTIVVYVGADERPSTFGKGIITILKTNYGLPDDHIIMFETEGTI